MITIEKAAEWFEKYLAEGNTIDDWLRDSKVVESGKSEFLREMKEKSLQYYVDNYPYQIIDMIDEVMENFDFDSVKKTMDALEWEWSMVDDEGEEELRIPTKEEIMVRAREYLKAVTYKNDREDKETCRKMSYETGGFRAVYQVYEDVDKGADDAVTRTGLTLEFIAVQNF